VQIEDLMVESWPANGLLSGECRSVVVVVFIALGLFTLTTRLSAAPYLCGALDGDDDHASGWRTAAADSERLIFAR